MGLTFRAATVADCPAMLRIRLDSCVTDQVDPHSIVLAESVPTLTEIENSVRHKDARDTIMIMWDGQTILGYAQIAWWYEVDGTTVYLHRDWVHPDHRDPSTMRWMLARVHRRITTLASLHRAEVTAVIATNVSESEHERKTLIEAYGYRAEWTQIEMEFTDFDRLMPYPVPEGITIRPVRAEDYRTVWQLNSAVYAGTWGATPPDFDDFLEVFDHPHLCDAAWEGGQIVGFVIGRTRRGVGFIDEMTVATPHQRRGIAAALLSRNLARYPTLGLPSVRLQTDAANLAGARALYEMLGFKPLKLHLKYRRPTPYL